MEQTSNGSVSEKPRYIDFPHLEAGTIVDGKQALNRWSSTITKGTSPNHLCRYISMLICARKVMTFPGRRLEYTPNTRTFLKSKGDALRRWRPEPRDDENGSSCWVSGQLDGFDGRELTLLGLLLCGGRVILASKSTPDIGW